ncbi:MAG: hypothetical protein AAF721_36970 [Myxococcota bacterium]
MASVVFPPGSRVRLSIIAGIALVIGVLALRGGDETPPVPTAAAHEAGLPAASLETPPDAGRSGDVLPADCAALGDAAGEGGPEAVALALLCPDAELPPLAARAVALATDNPVEAAAVAERLRGHPQLAALVTLVARTRVEASAATPTVVPAAGAPALPRPEAASVSPIDATVLQHAQHARALLYTKGVTHEARTRARAYLAKVVSQALLQLGLPPNGPAEPLSRMLAALSLHHGRQTAQAYWRRRVPGLAPVFAQLEDTLLTTLLALQGTPHTGDAARLLVERGRARSYVLSAGPQGRIDGRQQDAAADGRRTTAEVAPLADELARLCAHGWVDRAVQHILAAARPPEGVGLGVLRRLVGDSLIAANRPELQPRIAQRLALVRELPPDVGTQPLAPRLPSTLPSADAVADDAAHWLRRAVEASAAFPRAYAVVRATLPLRTRPDAVAVLVERAVAGDAPELVAARDLLRPRLGTHDGRRLSTLGLRLEAQGVWPEPDTVEAAEAQRRRRFAVALRSQ